MPARRVKSGTAFALKAVAVKASGNQTDLPSHFAKVRYREENGLRAFVA
jgi:hypothetical protein